MPQLTTGEKISFGVADVGASLTFVAINTWLLYYLINIVKLEPVLAGLVFLLGRIFDAVTDPIMGVVSDRLKPRLGRKPFIAWGAIPLGMSFALLWFIPEASQAVKFLLSTLFFLLFSLLYTIVQMPYLALIPELSADYNERTSLSSYRAAFGTFASLLAVALPPIMISSFSKTAELSQTAPRAWLMMGMIFGVITSVSYLIMALKVKEPKRLHSTVENTSFLREYRSAFSIFGFSQIFVLFIVITIGMMVLNSILPFFLESSLQLGTNDQSIILGTLFLVAILVFPLWNILAARLDKRKALISGLVIMALSLVLLVGFSPAGKLSFYLMLMTALAGIGLSAVMLFPWAMLPDVVEFDELATGRRREGLVYALFTFGQKIAGSIGVFSNAMVASIFGYQQGSMEQSANTVMAIRWMAGPVAAIIFLVAIIFGLRFPITKTKHLEARQKLLH
jgi:GPH family glycoside/pentoside/hexuronide:cation symporter